MRKVTQDRFTIRDAIAIIGVSRAAMDYAFKIGIAQKPTHRYGQRYFYTLAEILQLKNVMVGEREQS